MAQLALSQNNLIEALAHVEDILEYLEEKSPEGLDQPIQIYLSCYQVLSACQDARSQDILRSTYRLLQKRTAMISDDALRQSYLKNVSANREIVKLFQKFQ